MMSVVLIEQTLNSESSSLSSIIICICSFLVAPLCVCSCCTAVDASNRKANSDTKNSDIYSVSKGETGTSSTAQPEKTCGADADDAWIWENISAGAGESAVNCEKCGEIYFPEGAFDFALKKKGSDGRTRSYIIKDKILGQWFGEHLASMNEPPLDIEMLTNGKEVYRLLLLRSTQSPLVIRIEREDSRILLTTKNTDGTGGQIVGVLKQTRTRRIDRKNWEELKELIDESGFMAMEGALSPLTTIDGDGFVLEGVMSEGYRVVHRVSPKGKKGSEAKFFKVCCYILYLAGVTYSQTN